MHAPSDVVMGSLLKISFAALRALGPSQKPTPVETKTDLTKLCCGNGEEGKGVCL